MHIRTTRFAFCLFAYGCLLLTAISRVAQQSSVAVKKPDESTQGLTLTPSCTVEFSTDSGTWMSVDLSPKGDTVLFDLVGHIYKLPIQGGTATQITAGLSFDNQPRFSPDGKWIVYVSDRSEANNIWIANTDGTGARALTNDENTGFVSPAWTPDGRFIVVSRKKPEYYDSGYELWMYDVNGGASVQVTKSKAGANSAPDTWYNTLGTAASPMENTSTTRLSQDISQMTSSLHRGRLRGATAGQAITTSSLQAREARYARFFRRTEQRWSTARDAMERRRCACES